MTFTIQISNPEKEKVGGVYLWALIPQGIEVQKVSSADGTIWINPDTQRARAFIKPIPARTTVTLTIQAKVSSMAVPGEKYYAAARVMVGKSAVQKTFSNWVSVQIAKP